MNKVWVSTGCGFDERFSVSKCEESRRVISALLTANNERVEGSGASPASLNNHPEPSNNDAETREPISAIR